MYGESNLTVALVLLIAAIAIGVIIAAIDQWNRP
jgi:hypothetical protein